MGRHGPVAHSLDPLNHLRVPPIDKLHLDAVEDFLKYHSLPVPARRHTRMTPTQTMQASPTTPLHIWCEIWDGRHAKEKAKKRRNQTNLAPIIGLDIV